MEMRHLMTAATSIWPSKRDRLRHAEPTANYRLTTPRRLQGAATFVINRGDTAKSSVIGRKSPPAGRLNALPFRGQKADQTIQYP
jgi:hypothetical protein